MEIKNLSLEEKKAIVKRYSEGGVSEWEEICDTEITIIAPPYPTTHGLEALKKSTTAIRSNFKEAQNKIFTVEEMIAEGDAVAVRWSGKVTPKETFTVHGKTFLAGSTISSVGLSIIRLRNGKVIEEYSMHGE